MTSIPVSFSLPIFTTLVLPGFANIECQVGTKEGLTLRVTAHGGQGTPECASAATGVGPEGDTASHEPSQWLNGRYQPFRDTQGIRATSNPKPLVFGVHLPPSIELAQNYAGRSNPPHHSQRLVAIHPPSAEVMPDEQAQTLAALSEIAKWLRLHYLHLPEPIVGGLAADPAGLTDRFGVKGLSVYSAFIDMEYLRCRVCGHDSESISLAMLHQRHQRHYQT